ncbi:MAG: hypothetical protein PHY43_08820 [Verrucomicrobiales bacterium]|nr:hypothetical protein [Verrucomicrobiales bacterium]
MNWNTNAASTNTIYNILNPPVFAWSNLTFVVTATGTNTTLQFAGLDDPDYFGLDDVSVLAIPVPSFTAFSRQANAFSFTWNSLPGVLYQVQYSTNLMNSNWLVLNTNLATAVTTSFTNGIGGEPQRFYRIRRLP